MAVAVVVKKSLDALLTKAAHCLRATKQSPCKARENFPIEARLLPATVMVVVLVASGLQHVGGEMAKGKCFLSEDRSVRTPADRLCCLSS